MSPKKRAISYGRVSTESQLKGTSWDEQERKIREAAIKGDCQFHEFIHHDVRRLTAVIRAKTELETPLDTRFRGYDGCFDNPPEFWMPALPVPGVIPGNLSKG